MDVCYLILGRSWQYDMRIIHHGFRNTYSFVKDNITITLSPTKVTSPRSSTATRERGLTILLRTKVIRELETTRRGFILVMLESNSKQKEHPSEVAALQKQFVDVNPKKSHSVFLLLELFNIVLISSLGQ